MKKVLFSCLFLLFFISISDLLYAQEVSVIGDEPWNAIVISDLNQCLEITIDPAVITVSASVEAPGCAGNTVGSENPDLWLLVTVPSDGHLFISPPNLYGGDFGLAVYRYDTGSMMYNLLACDDDTGPGLMPLVELTGLIPGEILYLRYWMYNSSVTGTLLSCASSCNTASLYFSDNDNDSYGNATQSGFFLCQSSVGYVTNSMDCNDQDSFVFPGASEICDNGIDDDCSGADSTCIVLGCTDSTAINYNPQATNDDGSCEVVLTCNITTPTTTLCAGESTTLTMNTTGGTGASSQLPANLQQGLVAYYPFNGNANDESGNGNDGTVNGATLTSDRFGNEGGAYSFNGFSDNINCGSSIQILNEGTFSFWINNQDSEMGAVLTKWENENSPSGEQWWCGVYNDEIHFTTNNVGCGDYCASRMSLGANITAGQWVNIQIIFSSGLVSYYKDGILVDTENIPNAINIGSSSVRVGKQNINSTNQAFLGLIDDVFIYNRALSPSEIQQLYTTQSYAWSTNENTPTIAVSPTADTTYTCTVTQGNSTCTASVDITVNPLLTWYADIDGDGFGDEGNVQEACDQPQGFVSNVNDCNDSEVLAFTGALDICDNGIDEDCSGADSTCIVLGCTDSTAFNYNPQATNDDGGCEAVLTCEISGNSNICFGDTAVLSQINIPLQPSQIRSFRSDAVFAYNFDQPGFNPSDWQNNFTYDFWANPASTIGSIPNVIQACGWSSTMSLFNTSQKWIIFPGNNGNDLGLGVSVGTNGILIGTHAEFHLASRLSYSTNLQGWNHIAVSVLNKDVSLYINGALAASTSNTVSCNVKPSFSIGVDYSQGPYGRSFIGDFANVRIWNSSLTGEEILWIKDKQLTAGAPLPKTFYRVDLENLTSSGSSNLSISTYGNPSLQNFNLSGGEYVWNGTIGGSVLVQPNSDIMQVLWSDNTFGKSTIVTPNSTATYFVTVSNTTQTCTDSITITVNPLLTWYADNDGDGFGDEGNVQVVCDQPAGFVSNTNDCNDAEALSYTGAVDLCDNGIDEDCSGADSTCIVLGCTDSTAFNYNPQATNDDSSCEAILTCTISAPSDVICEGQETSLVLNSNTALTQSSDSLALWQSGYKIGPFQAYSTNPNCSVHSESKWAVINGATNLELFTLQHRYFDRSRIYDANNNLIWEWSGESVPAITWYGRHHSITIPSNDSIRIEFYSGFPGFCVGGLAITSLGNTSSNNVLWSTNETNSTINVSPNQNTTYTATVTTATQTCTDSITITVNPLLTWYADNDGDGFGDDGNVQVACDQPAGFVPNTNDCNDAEALAYTGAVDLCDNGIDEDCSGADSTCIVLGCTDITACNFNPAANTDDASCTYPVQTYLICDGSCINDTDGDGVCDEVEIAGCADATAFNYNPQATDDDGSCEAVLICNVIAPVTDICVGESLSISINSNEAEMGSSLVQSLSPINEGLTASYYFNDGNLSNAAAVGSINVGENRFGQPNGSYLFANNGYINLGNGGLDINPSSYSMSLWFKSNQLSSGLYDNTSVLITRRHMDWGPTWTTLQIINSGNLALVVDGPAYSNILNSNVNVLDNAWHHVVGVKDANNYSLYLDGNLVGSLVDGYNHAGSNQDFHLGHDGAWNTNFYGSLDDVNIFNRAVTGSEVQMLFGQNSSSVIWTTNEITPTITVSPTQTTTYTATVTTATQTCSDSITITVNPLLTWYADADVDGFGNPDDVVQDCNQPQGYVSDNTDCNDEEATTYPGASEICDNNRDENCDGVDSLCFVPVLGCTDVNACNFNPEANTDDNSCILPQPETCNGLDDNCNGQVDEGFSIPSINAVAAIPALYPTCTGNALKSANLLLGNDSPIIAGSGNDLWYSFTAQYNTLRVGLSAAFGDNSIGLYTNNNGCLELITEEHEVYTASTAATGNQILLTDQLTVGQTYYVAVHQITGPANASAKVCFTYLNESSCDHYYSNNTGIYTNVCNSFKAQYRANATNYLFNVLSGTQNGVNMNLTPWTYTNNNSNSVVARLGSILPANHSGVSRVYTMSVPTVYGLTDAAGNVSSLVANATSTCTITLNSETTITLRQADRCPTNKSITSTIAPDRTVCGAMRYDWEFTEVLPNPGTAQVVQGGNYSTAFFLSNVPGITAGKTYSVRVRPVHSSGITGNWGAVQCLRVGAAGMVQQSESEKESVLSNESRVSSISIYPNPTTTGSFVLQYNGARRGELIFAQESMTQLVMMDITGNVVFKTNVVLNGNIAEIHFGDLESGLYLVDFGGERSRVQVMK